MKLWKVMAVSALVFSGSSMASDFGGYGGGGGPSTPVFQTTNWNSELQIYQEGTLNVASAAQVSAHNSLTDISQHCNVNSANTDQRGDKSLLDINQAGNYNKAVALQSGDKSKLLISQSGTGNLVSANQMASGSLTNVVQVGTGNRAFAVQQ